MVDPVLITSATSIGGLLVDAGLRKLFACYLLHRKRDKAVVHVDVASTAALCAALHDPAGRVTVVDLEAETMSSLWPDTRHDLAALEDAGSYTQRDRLLTIYAKQYVQTLKRTYGKKAVFIFVCRSHALATAAGGVPAWDVTTLLPTPPATEALRLGMPDKARVRYDADRTEAVRLSRALMVVYSSTEELKQALVAKYKMVLKM